jgi:hypothetical protein
VSGSPRRRSASPEKSIGFNKWFGAFSDGSLESIRSDSTGNLWWYRVAPGSTRAVRLGDTPIHGSGLPFIQGTGTDGANSIDGRRFRRHEARGPPDIYILRNFGELLKR